VTAGKITVGALVALGLAGSAKAGESASAGELGALLRKAAEEESPKDAWRHYQAYVAKLAACSEAEAVKKGAGEFFRVTGALAKEKIDKESTLARVMAGGRLAGFFWRIESDEQAATKYAVWIAKSHLYYLNYLQSDKARDPCCRANLSVYLALTLQGWLGLSHEQAAEAYLLLNQLNHALSKERVPFAPSFLSYFRSSPGGADEVLVREYRDEDWDRFLKAAREVQAKLLGALTEKQRKAYLKAERYGYTKNLRWLEPFALASECGEEIGFKGMPGLLMMIRMHGGQPEKPTQ
jgi:hypothetical protein